VNDPRVPNQKSEINEKTKRIAERFAPIVFLHYQDVFRPSSVGWYLKRASLEYKNNKNKVLEKGQVTAQKLIDYQREKDYSDFTKGPINSHPPFNLKIENTTEIMNGDLATAECYVHIRKERKDNTNLLEAQYWFFYPYNGKMSGSVAIAAHEGDWECIAIRFDVPFDEGTNPTSKTEPKSKDNIQKVYFSQHGRTFGENNKNANIAFVGDRPVIFSAWHSHANYAKPGHYSGDNDYCDFGPSWETWRHGGLKFLKHDPAEENDASKDNLWNRFNGNWGGSSTMVKTPGIRGEHGWDAGC
jgi:Vacuolar protein sorting-associated protein 62